MRPLKAIREYCRYCMNGQENEIKFCTSISCNLYGCRFGKNKSDPHSSALQLIKKYCLDCAGDSPQERTKCPDTGCALYQFRNGHNPNIKVLRGAAQINSGEKKVVPDCRLNDSPCEINMGVNNENIRRFKAGGYYRFSAVVLRND